MKITFSSNAIQETENVETLKDLFALYNKYEAVNPDMFRGIILIKEKDDFELEVYDDWRE